jgi:hypothetical protein
MSVAAGLASEMDTKRHAAGEAIYKDVSLRGMRVRSAIAFAATTQAKSWSRVPESGTRR